MKKYITIISFLISTWNSSAQEILMQKEYSKKELHSSFGPNEKNQLQFSLSFSEILGPHGEALHIKYGTSNSFSLLLRYKNKLSGAFAWGLESGFLIKQYTLNPSNTSFPDTLLFSPSANHSSAKFFFNEIPIGAYFRINFDPRRGNTVGNYLDLGGQLLFDVGDDYIINDNLGNGVNRKTQYSSLPFINPYHGEAYIRLGSTFLALIFHYNLTDYFKTQNNFPKFPLYSLGLELNFTR